MLTEQLADGNNKLRRTRLGSKPLLLLISSHEVRVLAAATRQGSCGRRGSSRWRLPWEREPSGMVHRKSQARVRGSVCGLIESACEKRIWQWLEICSD